MSTRIEEAALACMKMAINLYKEALASGLPAYDPAVDRVREAAHSLSTAGSRKLARIEEVAQACAKLAPKIAKRK